MRRRGQGGHASLALFLSASLSAQACGTLAIPTGIGQSAPAPVASLDPLLDSSIGSLQTWLLLYRPLVWIGADDAMDAARSLAERIDANPDGRTFRVMLKPWTWSDGAPVTAADSVFTWRLIQRLGPLYAFAGQGGIPDRVQEVRAEGERQVTFVLRERTNPDWFILNGLSAFTPLPAHAWGDPDAAALFRTQADPAQARVVDGPFRLAEFAPGRYAAFVPNPAYGGHRSPLDRLVLDMVPGGHALALAQSGALDMAHLPPVLAARLPTPAGFHRVALAEPFGYRALLFNLAAPDAPFLRDARVRRALTEAADQQAMIRLVYAGQAHELRAPVPPGAWRAPDLNAATPRHDPADATRLLDTAGYTRGADGVRFAFSVLVAASNGEAQQELQILQQNLRPLGVVLKIRVVSEAALGATIFGGGAWQAAIAGYTRWGVPDGSSFFDTGGAGNPGGYSDPTMDRLIAASTREPGTAALFAYENYAAAQQPWNFLPAGGFTLQVSDRVRGLAGFLNPQGFWSPEYLSITCDVAHDRSAP